MNTIIHATEPAELLGIVPALAGFTPRQSIVLLPFHGTRASGAMRMDLPDPQTEADDFAPVALRALLQVSGVDAVAVVVYTDDAPQDVPDGILLPHLTLIEALLDVATDAGLRIVDALCVTPHGWGEYLEETPVVRLLDEIPDAPDIAGIGDVSGDQLSGAELPASDLVQREQVGRALREIEDLLERHRLGSGRVTAADSPFALSAACMLLDDLPAFAEELLDAPGGDDAYDCAALLWCLNRPVLRDAILVQWATDLEFGERALDAQLAFSGTGTGIPDAIGEIFLGRGRRPDPDRLGCALQLVRTAASRAPRDAQVGALTAAGWLAWALGRASHAGTYIDRALEIDPQHSMASLISTMLSAALLPEWTLQRG
ncbi:DUF4192 family protein [Microbacterium sp. MAHUQ-60]|uniref:DUF4192 family protein n=1 Tax=unclassified Microbacterium TaxID=2609290 RepID=UPI00361C047A